MQAKAEPLQEIAFHGIRPCDPRGRDGLANPERGLRIETLFSEPEGGAVWGPAYHLKGKVSPGYSDDWWIQDAAHYENHGLTLAQTYCYLDRFTDQPISNEKLELLQKSLNELRKHGWKCLLRFAYEKDTKRTCGPALDTILSHIEQLKPIIHQNTDVIYVLQAGFVGAWGEWHSSAHELEKDHEALAKITAKVLEIPPDRRMTQVRVPKYKRWVLSKLLISGGLMKGIQETAYSNHPAARIGFHNDGFLAHTTDGGTWPEPPYFANPGNPEFDIMTEESAFVPVDGELFWGDQGGVIDGLRAAARLRLHHYTSFSIAHSFSEREGKPYSIDNWMKAPLTLEDARREKLPIANGYFENESGDSVARTQFEYIRDHLGYRLELQRAQLPVSLKRGGELNVRLQLINRGFSAPVNLRRIYLLLISSEGFVKEFPIDADLRDWQPWQPGDSEFKPLRHGITCRVGIPADISPGQYQLALWMPDTGEQIRLDPRYAIRLANRDTAWWTNQHGEYGANVFAAIRVE